MARTDYLQVTSKRKNSLIHAVKVDEPRAREDENFALGRVRCFQLPIRDRWANLCVRVIRADEEAEASEDNYLTWPQYPDYKKFCIKCDREVVDGR